jgi:hypothetical protein
VHEELHCASSQDRYTLKQVAQSGQSATALLSPDMEVFAVTIFMSLAFAVLFAVLFFAERSQRQRRSMEQISLLPLDIEGTVSPVNQEN